MKKLPDMNKEEFGLWLLLRDKVSDHEADCECHDCKELKTAYI